ncbi:MAG TPA: MjaI family restriction endonuclease [Melioribacteraceae bacterium]|nr:MjaI family restriction endonuclease [Melioribacteraceae bacterium]
MSKEWILNTTMNRFQLNFKRNVGATSDEIRKCAPKSVDEWENYYFKNVKTKEHLHELGQKLFIKISEVVKYEVETITENHCIDYMVNMVIKRTYEGYKNEINTIYGYIEKELGVKPEPAPDEWDRKYNVDFYIKIGKYFLGIQIKPINKNVQLPEIFKEQEIQKKSHIYFKDNYGGNVFYVFSDSVDGKKRIYNPQVIDDIKN